MKITADTNFLISATQWNYSVSYKLFSEMILKDIQIFTTKEILEEFPNVLFRDFNHDEERIKVDLEKVLKFIKVIKTSSKIDIVKDDPDDNKIIECAVDSGSDYIITYDKRLLKIVEFKGIKILKPEEIFPIINQ